MKRLPTLPEPSEVIFVNTGADFAPAFAALGRCDIFGFDTKRPMFEGRTCEHPPSLLQVAGIRSGDGGVFGDSAAARDAHVYIFDLLALLLEPQFSQLIAPLLP